MGLPGVTYCLKEMTWRGHVDKVRDALKKATPIKVRFTFHVLTLMLQIIFTKGLHNPLFGAALQAIKDTEARNAKVRDG
jgi:ABC-type branched-subunit amino acid transport system permease subunit